MSTNSRRILRYVAAALSGGIAIVYLMIGFNIVSVVDTPSDQVFGLFAAVAYVLGVVLLVAFDRRVLWVLGAMLQVFVIYTYFNLAPQRSPSYEVWGILLRVAQFMILIPLASLALRLPQVQAAESSRISHHKE